MTNQNIQLFLPGLWKSCHVEPPQLYFCMHKIARGYVRGAFGQPPFGAHRFQTYFGSNAYMYICIYVYI